MEEAYRYSSEWLGQPASQQVIRQAYESGWKSIVARSPITAEFAGRAESDTSQQLMSPRLMPTPPIQELLGASWQYAYLTYSVDYFNRDSTNTLTLSLEQLIYTKSNSQLPERLLVAVNHHIWAEPGLRKNNLTYRTLSEGLLVNPETDEIIGAEDITRHISQRDWRSVTIPRRLDIGLCLAIVELSKII